jgi:hypothetical protein
VFVSVTVIALGVPPTIVAGNASEVHGDETQESVSVGGDVPVPERSAVNGAVSALLAIESVADCKPEAVGAKTTLN